MRIRILALALFLALAGHFARGQTTQTLSAANQCTAPIDVSRLGTLGMQMTGTWSATLQPEVAIAGNPAVNTQVTPSTSSTAQATITANGGYVAAVAGYSSFLVCVTAYVSGTVTIRFQTSSSVNAGLLGGGGVVTGLNGGILGTEGTCAATGFAPAVGLDLLCPSSLSGPLSSHGWLISNNGGAWQQLPTGSYPDLTDVAGVSLTSGVPFIVPAGSGTAPGFQIGSTNPQGFYHIANWSTCLTLLGAGECDIFFSSTGATISLSAGATGGSCIGFSGSNSSGQSPDTCGRRMGAGIYGFGSATSSDTSGSVIANGGHGMALKSTAAITGPVPVKADTSNVNQVVVTATTDTGGGLVIGVCANSPGVGANCNVMVNGVYALTLGTSTCAIGNFVIVDTTTAGRVKCTATYTAGTVIGVAMAADSTVGTAFNTMVGLR